jgi:branched-chain amino acid transport system permease protein
VVIVVAVVLVLAISAYLKFTGSGKAMRACAIDRTTSRLLGIRPERIGLIAIMLTAAIGGLGGIVVAPIEYTAYSVGLEFGIFGFIAAVIGGFGSVTGSLIGGLLVGLVWAFTGRYISATYEEVIALGLLLVLLVVRPSGLLGMSWEGEKAQ